MTIEVIGIAGGAGVGKDIIARKLARYGFRPFGLADDLKVMLVGKGALTYEEAFVLPKNERTRRLLVYIGEGTRLIEGEQIWVETARASMRRVQDRFGISRFVITDVRRPFEVDAVRALGGKVIGIQAPQRWAKNGLTDPMRAADTELFGRAFDEHRHLFDAVVNNDPENEHAVDGVLAVIMNSFGLSAPLNPQIRVGIPQPDGSGGVSTRDGHVVPLTVGGEGWVVPLTVGGYARTQSLEPLCLTCGPKNITWLGPTVPMCERCKKEFEAWQSRTVTITKITDK